MSRDPEINEEMNPMVEPLTKLREVMNRLEPGEHFLTIVFTDIRGFTPRVEREERDHGVSAAMKVKDEHDALIRMHLGTNAYVKSLGDGCLFLFDTVCAPIASTIALLGDFKRHNEPLLPAYHLEIRIGIHAGNVYVRAGDALTKWQDDPLSNAVNVASRIMNTAPPGTIHLNNTVYEHCDLGFLHKTGRLSLSATGSVTDLGFLQLKGLEHAYRIWQINPFGGRREPVLTTQHRDEGGSWWGIILSVLLGIALKYGWDYAQEYLRIALKYGWDYAQEHFGKGPDTANMERQTASGTTAPAVASAETSEGRKDPAGPKEGEAD